MADVIDSLFGPTPLQINQAQNAALGQSADKYAAQDPFARATGQLYRAGGMLAGPVAEQFGMVNPAIEEARRRQAVMASGGDLSTSAGLKAKAAQFAQAGDQQTAMKLLMVARKQEAEEAKIKLADQGEKRKEYAAKPDAEKYAMAMAKRSGLAEGTPEFDDFVSTWMYEQKEKVEKKAKLSAYATQLIEEGITEGSPEFQKRMAAFNAAEITSKTKPVGTSVTVSTGKGDSKYAEKRLSDAAEQLTAIGKAAESAWKSTQALERFEQASAGGTQGGAQPLITGVQNLLSSFGYTADALKDTRQMEQAIGDILGSKMVELGARGLTDKDMEVLRQSLPRVDTDRGSRANVVSILKKANKATLDEYENARTEEARVYPDLATRITNPGWYKAYKSKAKPAAENPVAAIPTEQKSQQGSVEKWERDASGKLVRVTR